MSLHLSTTHVDYDLQNFWIHSYHFHPEYSSPITHRSPLCVLPGSNGPYLFTLRDFTKITFSPRKSSRDLSPRITYILLGILLYTNGLDLLHSFRTLVILLLEPSNLQTHEVLKDSKTILLTTSPDLTVYKYHDSSEWISLVNWEIFSGLLPTKEFSSSISLELFPPCNFSTS
jgi:hypothetical protein